ncbi:MAG: ABC transporter ATP-binding protein [Bacteroidota bacterium]|nr:ABC transporter ATP-binding protein [Bacteroidota bacterium]
MSNDPIISVKNMDKKFGDFYANRNLNFDVKKGEIFGFLGANGAGKTTAIKILCGLSKPTAGEIKVAGCDVYSETEKLKNRIGYMSQKFSLYEDLTVWENLRLYAGIYGVRGKKFKQKAERLLEQLNFMHARKKLIRDIPTGWRQKLAFISAVFHNPDIVFLDEPTGGVDPVTRRQFWDMIYEKADAGTTIFVTTHYMDEAEYCNRVSVMDKGEIVALGEPQKLMADYQANNMDEVFLAIAG